MSDVRHALAEPTGFDDVLDRYRNRSRRRVVLASLGVVLVLVSGGFLVSSLRPEPGQGVTSSDGWRVDGPPPQAISVGGRTLERRGTTPIFTVRLADGADDRTLVVAAGEQYRGTPTQCTQHTEIRLTEQDSTQVRLVAFVYKTDAGPADVICPAIGRPPKEVTVDLGAPLAGRRVYTDGHDTPAVVHDPAAELRLTTLPAGYSAQSTVTFEPRVGTWRRRHEGDSPGTRLEVHQGAPAAVEGPPGPGRTVVARITVRGQPAELFTIAGYEFTCLVWRERADLSVEICVHGDDDVGSDDFRRAAEGLEAAGDPAA